MWSSHRGRPSIGEDRRIELLRKLGEDPIGSLWDAGDHHFRRKVTVRVFRDDLGAHRRFMQALRTGLTRVWPRLKHANIAGAITYVEGPDAVVHIVMERLEGETLAERLDRAGSIEATEARRIAAEVRAALEAAHAIGLVHGGLTPHSVFLTRAGGVKVLDFGIPAALWTTAREAAEAVGDGSVALPLDRERDARDLELLEQRMLSGHPASGEFDLRRLIELVLASPAAPSVAPRRPIERSRGRRRPTRRRLTGSRRRTRRSRGAIGAWAGQLRDSVVDATSAVWSIPGRAARWTHRSRRSARTSFAGGLWRVASGPGRGMRAATRPLRRGGRAVVGVVRTLVVGTGRGLRTLVVGTGRGLRTLVVGTGRGLRTLVVGTGRGLRTLVVGTGRGLRTLVVGTGRGLRTLVVGTGRGLRTLVVGTGRGLRTLVVGTGRGLRTLTHPIRPAGRHVAGATRAVVPSRQRGAPATRRLLRQAMYPLVGAGLFLLVVVVGVGIFEGVPTSVVRERPAAASAARSTAQLPPPVTGGVTVPDVNGLSPMEAGALLSATGLSVVDAEPAPGPPGTVVGTDPAVNEVVDPATPIVLLVGASPDRMDDDN